MSAADQGAATGSFAAIANTHATPRHDAAAPSRPARLVPRRSEREHAAPMPRHGAHTMAWKPRTIMSRRRHVVGAAAVAGSCSTAQA